MSNAGSVTVVLSANTTSFSAALTEAQRNLDKLSGKTKDFSGHSVSSMQAASASIRLLENPLGNNIRAIERLISQSKILSEVMRAAFPLVGAIAIGSMLVKLGTEVADFIKKVNEMPTAIKNGFAALSLSQKTATDELTVTNDKLGEAIAKLEHKPVNNAKTAMDELTLSADKAAEHIVSANNKLNELLSRNHLSGFAVLFGKQGTGDRENAATKFGQQSSAAAYDLANATTPAQTKAAQDKLAAIQNAQLADARQDLARRQAVAAGPESSHTDDSANMNIDKGIITTIINDRKQQQAELDNVNLSAQKDKDEAAKTAAEQAKQAAQQAKEAADKAANERLKSFQDAFDKEKLAHSVDLSETYTYWQSKLSAFKEGSSQYQEVLSKETAAAVEAAARAHEAIAKQQKADRDGTNNLEGTDIINRSNEFLAKVASDKTGDINAGYIDANQLAMVNAKNDAELKANQIQEQSGKTMTRIAVATQLAAIHTQEYVTQLNALQAIASIRNAAAQANPDDKVAQKAAEDANASLSNASRARQIQIQSDTQATTPQASLASVGFVDALDDFVTASQDAASQMKQIADNTLSTLNSELLKGMTGQRMDWKNAGSSVFRNVASAGLNKVEGSALSALGFGGKPDGSQAKPLYVRMADGVSGVANSAGNFLSRMFSGSAAGSTASAISGSSGGSSLLNGMGSLFMSALPMLADGGPLSANTMAIVGERGPELFMPSTSGHVIPNHQLGGIGGFSHQHTWNIDARGATDPAQVRAQVMQGITEAAPHIIAASQKAGQEAKKRSSPSAQR